jgi:putative methyltransferase (TIGR04325 family)
MLAYPSYTEALKNSKTPEGYSNRLVARVVAEKTKQFRNTLSVKKELELGDLRASSFLVMAGTKSREELKVIDFGGACGYHYYICKSLIPNQRFDWRVIETESMVTEAQEIHHPNELSFFTDTNLAVKDGWVPNAIFASSSIQYHEQPLLAWKNLLELQSDLVFITRTPLSMLTVPIISIQTSQLSANGPGPLPVEFEDVQIEYPITFTPKQEIIDLALRLGYRLNLTVLEDRGTVFAGRVPINISQSLVFIKDLD